MINRSTSSRRSPALRGIADWFDTRHRSLGMWAFTLNRVTALGLTVYLFMHLLVLGKLAQGPEAYDEFIALAKSPLFIFGEWLVVTAALIHGLNGIRLALNGFGIGTRHQKELFLGLMALAAAASLLFAVRMVPG